MDRVRFDALTRLLAAGGSRRGVLGALLGGTLLGGLEAAAKKKNKNKNKRKNKNKQQSDDTCFGTLECEFPSDGKDFEDCYFENANVGSCNGCNFRGADLGYADLTEGSYQGASFRSAGLRNAYLDYSDVSGASFRDACLNRTSFLGANIDGADFRGAFLCDTQMPDGSIDDSGCDNLPDCCPPCIFAGKPCGDGIFGECCDSVCDGGVCVAECFKDTDCDGGSVCCNNQCFIGDCCTDSQCEPFGNQCVSFECVCGDGPACLQSTRCCGLPEDDIPFTCVDLETDNHNCGNCLVTCFDDAECINGTCELECEKDSDCPSGEVCDDGFCVDEEE